MDHSSILNLRRDTWKVSCWHRRCSVAKQPRSGKLSGGALGKVKGNRRGCTPLIVSPLVQSFYQLLNCPNGPFHFGWVLNLIEVLSYVTVEGDEMEGGQRVRLVSRPMQQNIFWDESEGQILDVRELLQPSPQVTDPNVGDTMSDKPLMENGIRRPEM